MRALLALFLLACCSCAASSSGTHARGLRQGPWTDYFPNGNKQSEGEYENDVQSGRWTWWFENGNKELEGSFVDERRAGTWTSWHENGALRAQGRFENGFEEGVWRFYDSSGALECEGSFELGQPALRWTRFLTDGSVRETGCYRAGVKVGPWTKALYPMPAGCEWVEERFDDATLRRTGFLREGVPDGRWSSFHPGGKLRLECSFANGVPEGSAHAWRADGSLLASGRLQHGCVSGTWIFERAAQRESREAREARPRQPFAGEWSPASSADQPGWTALETWVAEICAPRQPAPIPPAAAAPTPAQAAEDLAGIPARAQPWTEHERRVLPQLLALYGSGRSSGADEYEVREFRTPRASPPADLLGRPLPLTSFTTAKGAVLDLDRFLGKQNVLVTILRGFGGQVCVYCSAQTKALAGYADKFAALDTQVVVVFPGPASGLKAFLEAYRRTFGAQEQLPYELLYDTDMALTRALHIEDNIALPTSILLDRQGIIRWCRVGKDRADRPSAQEILEQISALSKPAR